jgi:hypothetical protein
MHARPMKRMSHVEVVASLFIALIVLGGVNAFGQQTETKPKSASPGPPVVPAAPNAPAAGQVYVYDQKPLPGRPPLVQPEQAQAVIDKFKIAYAKMGNPRMLIYINRDLVDENTGVRLIARTEKGNISRTQGKSDRLSQKSGTNGGSASINGSVGAGGQGSRSSETEKTAYENRYRNNDRKEQPLADRQTTRDVERLFGRPLRLAGAGLADQRLATQMMADHPFKPLNGGSDQAQKDREALEKIADVVVEVLISSKNVQVAEVSGDRTYALPDIQATAMRLKDARILGQASSSDITGRGGRNFDVREISEATALALMEDMLTSAESPSAAAK